MGDQVGVERVVAGHENPQASLALASGAADLLPHRRTGAREPRHHDGVEPVDVDAQLESVGGRHRQQISALEAALDLAAILGKVAAAVGRHLVGQVGVDLRQRGAGLQRDGLGAAPAAYERERTNPVGHEVSDQVGRLGRRRASYRRAVLAVQGCERRLPQGDSSTAARRAVGYDGHHGLTHQPRRAQLRARGGGGREHERGGRSVVCCHASQSPDDLGDVRAEDASVVVALVDHDDTARIPRTSPSGHGPAASSGAACRDS